MSMIMAQMLQNLKTSEGMSIAGEILMQDYTVSMTKNGKEYLSGTAISGVAVKFKVWNNSPAFSVLRASDDYKGKIVTIQATVDCYGGEASLILNNVSQYPGVDLSVGDFLASKYNIPAYAEGLVKRAEAKITAKGMKFLNDILFNNETMMNRFKEEFAANAHHDNCKGGLLAHTYKVMSVMSFIVTQYPDFCTDDTGKPDTDALDLLYIGCILHDIGKTVELEYGVYQPKSCVTHAYLGVEMLAPYKEKIISAYDEQWYYDLVSILLQHHGDFGMPCKTLAAYLVHRADELEASLTLLDQKCKEARAVGKVYFDGKYLQM